MLNRITFATIYKLDSRTKVWFILIQNVKSIYNGVQRSEATLKIWDLKLNLNLQINKDTRFISLLINNVNKQSS